jgi:hypothetical protein
MNPGTIELQWERFPRFREACAKYGRRSCVYALTDRNRIVHYVGKASTGLQRRYSQALGALDAVMFESTALLFVAGVDKIHCEAVEATLIFWEMPPCNTKGIRCRPRHAIRVVNRGEAPGFCARGETRDQWTGKPL